MRSASFITRRFTTSASVATTATIAPRAFFSVAFASEKLFTKSHEWVIIDDASKTATIGLANYAIKELNDITYVDLPAVGTAITQDEEICSIESVKAVVGMKAPVSGELSEVNMNFEDAANLAKLKDGGAENEAENWFFKAKDVSYDKSSLMTAEEFNKFVESE